MKNILYVIISCEGGAAIGTHELLCALPKDKYKAYIVLSKTMSNAEALKGFKSLSKEITYIPMSWWNINSSVKFYKRFFIWLRISIKTLFHIVPIVRLCLFIKRRKINIVYTTNSQLIDGAIAAWICRRVHIWHVKEHVKSKILIHLINNFSKHIILISKFVSSPFKDEKKQIIYEGIDLKEYGTEKSDSNLRHSLGIEKDELVVAMAGNITNTEKEHTLFIEMAGILNEGFPKTRFVIFGIIPKPHTKKGLHSVGSIYFGKLQKMIEEKGLKERLILAGFIRDIPLMMRSIDILVHPCSIEGFGRVAIEAMAAARPVVGPDKGGIKESVIHGITGLIARSGNPKAFAEKAAILLNNPGLRLAMGQEARLRVKNEFSIQKHVEKITYIYDNPKNTILYLVGQLGPGGLERQLYYILKEIDKKRFKVSLAVWNYEENDVYFSKIKSIGIPIHSLGKTYFPFIKIIRLRELVKKIKPDIVHSYSFYTNFAGFCSTLFRNILCIGSVQSNFIMDRHKSGLLGLLSSRWPRSQVFNSLTALKNSKLLSGFFTPSRYAVVRNGLDLKVFKPARAPYVEKTYIAAIGSLVNEKCWERLLLASSNLKEQGLDFCIKIAGDGPLKKDLCEKRDKLGIGDRVEFLGYREDIPELLSKAAFLVHTSDIEGSPNAVMEAMGCGKAVVANDTGDIKYLIDDFKTGFVIKRGNEAELTNKIAALIKDRELCRKMGEKGRIKAEEEFHLRRFTEDMISAYKTLGEN